MPSAVISVIVFAMVSHVSLPQEPSRQEKPQTIQTAKRSMREIVNMPVVYRVPDMDKVIVKSDLKYTTTNDPNLLMDVYLPPRRAKSQRRPAVVLIPGDAAAQFT